MPTPNLKSNFARVMALVAFAALAAIIIVTLPSKPKANGSRPVSKLSKQQDVTGQSNAASKGVQASLKPGPNLAPGSNPSVLPSDVLIADEGNNRILLVNPEGKIVWQFPSKNSLAPGQTFLRPDDAFFTPNGKDIIATEETDQVISLISFTKHPKILWRYGTPGVAGHTPGLVDNPDDALMMPNGDVITADIKNCNILIIPKGGHLPLQTIGITDPYCYHQPPHRWASPNGAFPMSNGDYLITEINGDWVDELNIATGKVLWSTHPPSFTYPSDSNQVGPNTFISVDYTKPGAVEEFTKHGRLLWRYAPTSGPGMLNHPSLCAPIPTNGDILCNDDGNDRVIVIDPHTNKIVWQYGHTGVPGTAPGYLNDPDGTDLAPPYSMLMTHAKTMGLPATS
ncbi:MAG: PQQ-binding-like beta-propeller repeat protein [Actinobacteria bacterium]|jgi:outer membrane protein assembly factor BamB|nr:PQQ-binding-like beta-propeller repeat protein [Actinomycetota bacterium]MCL6094991.1 PQQ-binding-like beta-propeller repeat protein [Actinomycetota bacterium]